MKRLCEYPKIVDVDLEDAEDPEQLLNEWLGELDNLTGVSDFGISKKNFNILTVHLMNQGLIYINFMLFNLRLNLYKLHAL